MNFLQRKIGKLYQHFVNKTMGGLSQEMTAAEGERYVTPGMPELVREAAAEGCVLLRNDGVLPLSPDQKVAVFGRCQYDWFHVGYGSGGDVHAPYEISLTDALQSCGANLDTAVQSRYLLWTHEPKNKKDDGFWGHWPFSYPEMPLPEDLVRESATRCGTALVVIGRAAGEDRENELQKGSYYLTDEELRMLRLVTKYFGKTVLILNTGSIIDMSFTEEFGDRLPAILLVWLGGMEAGNALSDVLYGAVSPSGRLPDTIARHYEDYPSAADFGGRNYNNYSEGIFVGYRYFDLHPEKILWPFGFGLSYTDFRVSDPVLVLPDHSSEDKSYTLHLTVRNTGTFPGKETVLLFMRLPEGRLEKPCRVLCAFEKTSVLRPGESTDLCLSFDEKAFSSYDEKLHAFILEPGTYRLELNGADAGSIEIPEERIVESCHALCAPGEELRDRILSHIPFEIPKKTGHTIHFSDVRSGKAALDDFIAELSDLELEALSRGHGMMGSVLGTPGNAGVFGGIIPSLQKKGLRAVTCCDGPAGLRMRRYCALLPCGTALAATFDTALVRKLHELLGAEMSHYQVDVHLAPGMNIHRNPLCGRNFEYFSEDPLLSGRIAAAAVSGVQKAGHASCPKHFACNNQETRRSRHDSRVSERTLREIYLRNFEIVVKEAKPLTIMTSYNKINGVWSHYNYDLVTTVLREEWGFTGLVLTDWWMKRSKSPEFPLLRDNAYRVRAQVDVLMPGDRWHMAKKYRSDGTLLKTLGKLGGITRGELQRTAKNVLNLMLRLKDPQDPEQGTESI